MFYLVHDEETLYGMEIRYLAEDIEDELLVAPHVGGMDFEEIVVAARDVVALGNLRDALDDTREVGSNLAVDLRHLDIAEDDEALVELLCVEDGDIFLDVARLLETFVSLKDRCRREADMRSELLHRQTGVVLQGLQDL